MLSSLTSPPLTLRSKVDNLVFALCLIFMVWLMVATISPNP